MASCWMTDGFRGQDREMYARVFECHREDPSLTVLISICSLRFLRFGRSTSSVVAFAGISSVGLVVTGNSHTLHLPAPHTPSTFSTFPGNHTRGRTHLAPDPGFGSPPPNSIYPSHTQPPRVPPAPPTPLMSLGNSVEHAVLMNWGCSGFWLLGR